MRNLAIFDIDGTLTESVAVDEVCFVQAFRDGLGIERINTNWLDYQLQTDSGLALEIGRNHLGRDPGEAEISRLQARFIQLLCAAVAETGQPMREIPGAAALLHRLVAHHGWHVAIATGGWQVSARFKLDSAGLPVDGIPWASADDASDRVAYCAQPCSERDGTTARLPSRRLITLAMVFGTCGRRRRWGSGFSVWPQTTRLGDWWRRVPRAYWRTSLTLCV
jgi:hypothetical protein